MDASFLILVAVAILVVGFLFLKKKGTVDQVVHKVEDIKSDVASKFDQAAKVIDGFKEATVTAPGKQPEIVAIVPSEPNAAPRETLKYIDVIPPKGTFLEDMNGRSYQLYVQTYREFPPSHQEVKATPVPPSVGGVVVNPSVPQSGDPRVNAWIADFKAREGRSPTDVEVDQLKSALGIRDQNLKEKASSVQVMTKEEVNKALAKFDAESDPMVKWKNLSTIEIEALRNRGFTPNDISQNINKANGQFSGPWA